ncbi:hypothetical protein Thert_01159 [Thermoanaerobacterium thermosaccharolyticum]|uniref:Uncharacterized protein n=1 Tax=Thermoanaerobacterium thermosaccharolyticum TaxID=1517 RepID=A0A223HXQ7_THETR|nr:hypothetical protein Thert_01159 [Thermoanaerobacterium thermosaccharolyticum]
MSDDKFLEFIGYKIIVNQLLQNYYKMVTFIDFMIDTMI